MQVEIERLRSANTLLSKRKLRKRKVLKGATTISVAQGLELGSQLTIARDEALNKALKWRPRRCGRCREPGHQIKTCKQLPIDTAGPLE
jgi:hypothetical protein